jgi:hypothetical protein
MWFPGHAAFPTLGPPGGAAFPRSRRGRPRGSRRLSTVCGEIAHGLYTEHPFYCNPWVADWHHRVWVHALQGRLAVIVDRHRDERL